ncbi:class I SAM-dependent methyltransferase [Herbiconiux sp. CPCC 205763]|uniref:Class I SAM-dependent methyltransferase n=1 Tax=Herbiconiux aconitum TaxID=2970913 RepID=A0ABT2GQ23_9MICO|nr:class I SAM-dependent methyltransferase [Herbiconiux aconitum]MCS5718236.1 class I SAM-dependent methyltransferase [Herbiconiux aconitum]
MDSAELSVLLTAEGLRLLDSLPLYSAGDSVKQVSALRKAGHSAELVAAVLTQSRLREKARAKFGAFADRLLFTPAGLEQATRLKVAAMHAGRFRDAGIGAAGSGGGRIADLGCGIGADALALAALDLPVVGVERDEVTAAIATYNLAGFPSAEVVLGDAETFPLDGVDAVYLDPARRTGGTKNTSRLTRPEDYSPSVDFAFGLAERLPTGIKLGPGFDRSLIPGEAEAQWVSVDGQVVEMGLWFGALARPGIRRSALVVDQSGASELTAESDSPDVSTRPLGDYLYEPDGAVIRARLIGALAERLDAGMLSRDIAYLTGDELVSTPFAAAFRVQERLPAGEAQLKKALRERRIGTLEIKKRGIDVDPATLRTRLALKGPEAATLILTRVDGAHEALLVDRVAG